MFWTMVGWIYSLVLWAKDDSKCLDKNLTAAIMNLRSWLLYDFSIAIILFILVILVIIRFIKLGNQMHIWKYNDLFRV